MKYSILVSLLFTAASSALFAMQDDQCVGTSLRVTEFIDSNQLGKVTIEHETIFYLKNGERHVSKKNDDIWHGKQMLWCSNHFQQLENKLGATIHAIFRVYYYKHNTYHVEFASEEFKLLSQSNDYIKATPDYQKINY